MISDKTIADKVEILNDLSMDHEVSVYAFSADDYLKEFYEFFEIKYRDQKIIPSTDAFSDTLKELSGDDVWMIIAEKTVDLFGEPKRVAIFEDADKLINELEGPDGLAPFFFVFDIMFCEYDGFALCFISGTNN